ncbi:MAG: hypothetical protein IJ692_05870 [Alloprevotella sp.]|nr:hypothetical protein [Alloprevotella sp.]
MKKTLLFMALVAITLGASAQTLRTVKNARTLNTELKATPKLVDFRSQGTMTSKVMRAPRRLTSETPTVQAYRPEGFFWFFENWDGSSAPDGVALGPSGVDVTFFANFSAENSKWLYSDEKDGEEYSWKEQDVTEADSALTANYGVGFWPAPMAIVSSRVGASALKAQTVADSATFAASAMAIGFNGDGVMTNSAEEFVPMAVGNVDPTYYLGSANIGSHFATNSETADNALATQMFGGEKYGVVSATTHAFIEFFPMNEGSEALINSIDFTMYNPDQEPAADDVLAAVLPVLPNGQFGEPLGVFALSDYTTFTNNKGEHWGHSCSFTPLDGTPVLVEGQSFVVEFSNAEGSEFSIVPLTNVVTDTGDGNYGYALLSVNYHPEDEEGNFTEEVATDTFLQETDVYNWGDDSYVNTSLGIRLHMSYDPAEVEAHKTGIKTTTVAKKGAAGTFDLQGRRVANAQKGVFIENGQKVIK